MRVPSGAVRCANQRCDAGWHYAGSPAYSACLAFVSAAAGPPGSPAARAAFAATSNAEAQVGDRWGGRVSELSRRLGEMAAAGEWVAPADARRVLADHPTLVGRVLAVVPADRRLGLLTPDVVRGLALGRNGDRSALAFVGVGIGDERERERVEDHVRAVAMDVACSDLEVAKVVWDEMGARRWAEFDLESGATDEVRGWVEPLLAAYYA